MPSFRFYITHYSWFIYAYLYIYLLFIYYLFIYLFIHIFIYLSIYLSIHLFIYLFIYYIFGKLSHDQVFLTERKSVSNSIYTLSERKLCYGLRVSYVSSIFTVKCFLIQLNTIRTSLEVRIFFSNN
jgi:hypothetical protein